MSGRDGNEGGRQGPKSVAGKPALRSRGFLSHGGMPAGEGADAPKRSRGMRGHDDLNDTAPRELASSRPRRPYTLDEK